MMTRQATFKSKHKLNARQSESMRIMDTWDDKIPVICEFINNKNGYILNKTKYIVPKILTLGSFSQIIRKYIYLDNSHTENISIILFTASGQINSSQIAMGEIYQKYKDAEDGFLYLYLTTENTFG